MPHIDELLGVATLASAGLFAAMSLQPAADADHYAAKRDGAGAVSVVATSDTTPVVRLPSIEVVARRSVELAQRERKQKVGREWLAPKTVQPDA